MTRERTTRACLTLRARQVDELREISRESGAPVTELTRRAIDAYLAGRRGAGQPPESSPGQPTTASA